MQELADDSLKLKNNYDCLLLDFPKVVHIPIPLDVAFARLILRDFSQKDTRSWSQTYLTLIRPLPIAHKAIVSQQVDKVPVSQNSQLITNTLIT